jgi:hypothetical protein
MKARLTAIYRVINVKGSRSQPWQVESPDGVCVFAGTSKKNAKAYAATLNLALAASTPRAGDRGDE